MPNTELHCPQCQAVFLPAATDAPPTCPACGTVVPEAAALTATPPAGSRSGNYAVAAPFAPPPALSNGSKLGRKTGPRRATRPTPREAAPSERPTWVMPLVWGGTGLFVLLGIVLLIVCLGGSGTTESDEVVQGPAARPKALPALAPGKSAPLEIKPLAELGKKGEPKLPIDLQPVDDPPAKGPGKEGALPPSKEGHLELPHGPPDLKDPTPPKEDKVTEPVQVARPRQGRPQLLPDLPVLTPVEFKVHHPVIAQAQSVKKSLRLAVTPPQFDDMGKLLHALGQGYQYTSITPQDLYNLTRLTQFDVVFLTCSGSNRGDTRLNQSLRGFVERGGTLYASDLRFDTLAAAFPEYVDQGQVGRGGRAQTLNAKVVDPGLRDLLGDEIQLRFNLAGWKPAAFRKSKVNVLLEGAYTSGPVAKALTSEQLQLVKMIQQEYFQKLKTGPGTKALTPQERMAIQKEFQQQLSEIYKAAPVTPNKGGSASPLLVKFGHKKGAVIFTSFHNAAQNSDLEKRLLEYLVFTAVTVQVEAEVRKSMLAGGFAPEETRRFGVSVGKATEVQTYTHAKEGPVQFALGFEGQNVKVRFTMQTPGRKQLVHEDDKSFIVEIPSAPAGEWHFTVTALNVPFPNYPLALTVGARKLESEK